MTFRRRPIPQFKLKPETSLRYETIAPGVIRYPDEREVCLPNAAGWREYARRVKIMVQRQNFKCCLCGNRLNAKDATFEHQRRREMGSAWRDDRVLDAEGNWVNGASHWTCNGKRG